jgi:predicted membrane protein
MKQENPGASRSGDTGRRRMISIFGDITQTGTWPLDRKLLSVAVFGDIDLDLRQANVPASGVAITAVAPLGSVDVLVPAGVTVDVHGFTLFGGTNVSAPEATSDQDKPVVRVRGFSLLGKLKVWSA